MKIFNHFPFRRIIGMVLLDSVLMLLFGTNPNASAHEPCEQYKYNTHNGVPLCHETNRHPHITTTFWEDFWTEPVNDVDKRQRNARCDIDSAMLSEEITLWERTTSDTEHVERLREQFTRVGC